MNIHRKVPKPKISKLQYDNAARKERGRKAEHLRELANSILRRWCVAYSPKSCSSPKTVATTLKRLSTLPPRWTEEDYKTAFKALSDYGQGLKPARNSTLEGELVGTFAGKPTNIYRLTRRNCTTELLYEASLLEGCIFSLLYLCDIPNDTAATLLIDVCREIGRTLYLAGQRNIRHTLSTALCLMLLPNDYEKPDWAKEMVKAYFEGNAEPQIIFGSPDD